ncbi:MAG: hypothetical protein G01um101425_45 [Candidatus Peregrinibacteria bacterium Gr01-1014_25]|nr:MAG: hypothetical protein G01um101425_45 [Candidatus Peregrinibacteria bacterium Gr01-1014_25]
MPIVTITGLPAGERKLEKLAHDIQHAIAGIKPLGLTEKEITVEFPADLLPRNGKTLIGRIFGLFAKPERTERVRQDVLNAVILELQEFADMYLPSWKVIEVFLDPPFDASKADVFRRTAQTGGRPAH